MRGYGLQKWRGWGSGGGGVVVDVVVAVVMGNLLFSVGTQISQNFQIRYEKLES